jgi:hypothetical protein
MSKLLIELLKLNLESLVNNILSWGSSVGLNNSWSSCDDFSFNIMDWLESASEDIDKLGGGLSGIDMSDLIGEAWYLGKVCVEVNSGLV